MAKSSTKNPAPTSDLDHEVSLPSPQRDALLAAAVEILRTKGPAGFTVRNVTERAACSTTGVYTWFGGKQGLAEAVFCGAFDRFDATMATNMSQLSGSAGRAGATAYRQWALANPTDYIIMFGKAIPDYEPSPAALERALASFELLVTCVRSELAASSGPVTDARVNELALRLWSVLHGFVMLELTQMIPIPGDREVLYDAAVEQILSTFRTE